MSLERCENSFTINLSEENQTKVKEFIEKAIGKPLKKLSLLSGGANNQVLLADCGDTQFVVKKFCIFNNHLSAKLKSELAFYQLTNKMKLLPSFSVSCPNLLAHNESEGLLLLSCIESEFDVESCVSMLEHAEAREMFFEQFVQQSVDFLFDLNQSQIDVAHLPLASDATGSFEQVKGQLNKRYKALKDGLKKSSKVAIPCEQDVYCQAFVAQYLTPWLEQTNRALSELNHIKFPMSLASPSDFGLHNVMIDKDNKTFVFIDFEYAGCDSAIKLVCDYFCQPKFPIPTSLITKFYYHPLFAEVFDDIDIFMVFLKATQLKWCFILLNEFVPEIAQRRQFSSAGTLDLIKQKALQLHKCQQYFNLAHTRAIDIEQTVKQLNLASNKLKDVSARREIK